LYTKKALKKSFILNGKTILDYADINHWFKYQYTK
jgi:hypothetical protein